jgi:hypothetical protein
LGDRVSLLSLQILLGGRVAAIELVPLQLLRGAFGVLEVRRVEAFD